jgi:hypothetical protein
MRFHYGPYAARLDVDRAVTVPLCRHVDDGPGGDDLPTLRVERGDVPEGEGLRAALPGWAALVTEQHVLVRIHDHAREDYAFYNQLFAALGLARVILDGGLVLHASSIAVEGRAYLFAGLSGAGKSTVSRRVGAGRRIADDQSMLLPTPEGWWCRNAFPEDEAGGSPHRLFLIRQATRSAVRPLATARALPRVMRHLVLWDADGDAHARVLENLSRFLAAVPCFELDVGLADIRLDLLVGELE